MKVSARARTLRSFLIFCLASGVAASAYAESDYPPWKVGLSLQNVAAAFELKPLGDTNNSRALRYRPAQANYFGVILGYRWLSGAIAFAVPANPETRNLEGISRYRDYRLSYYLKRFGVELNYNRFLGYVIDNSEKLSQATLQGARYYRVPDLETLGYGFNVLFVPSATTSGAYSLAAALDQSELQKASGGAAVLIAAFRDQQASVLDRMIPPEKRPDFGQDQNLRRYQSRTASVGGGYGYHWVPGVFFMSGLLAASVGAQWTQHDRAEALGIEGENTFSVPLNLHLRIGLGLNSRRMFLTGNLHLDRIQQRIDSIEIGNENVSFTFAAGARF